MAWSEQPEISLVIPVYRAGVDLPARLQTLAAYIEQSTHRMQIIFVDDGSQDGTEDVLMEFAHAHEGASLIRHATNFGKGRSVADGVAVATGDIIIFTDIDVPYDLSVIETMVQRFENEPHIHFLVGSRRVPESKIIAGYGAVRTATSWVFTMLARMLVRSPFTDVQCGIKGFRRDAARLLFSNLTIARFAFDVELFLRARKYQLSFAEVPVQFSHAQHTTVQLVPTTLRMLRDLFSLYGTYR